MAVQVNARAEESETRELDGLQGRALILGGVALALTLVGGFLGDAFGGLHQLFESYLFGFIFWIGLALGGLGLTVLHQLTGGAWGMLIRRVLEAAARTIPYMALLFIPIAIGLITQNLYREWIAPENLDPLLQHKLAWLNIPFFLGRAALYFAVWTFIAYRISSWAAEHDRTGSDALDSRLRGFGGLAMILIFLTVTFAMFDWIMSLEPHWFSSIYGAAVAVGMALCTFAFSVLVTTRLARRGPVSEVFSARVIGDVGTLMMAFTLIWAYLNLSQLIIMYAANLPEEATWYLKRTSGGWQFVALALIVLHFVLPFTTLMADRIRRDPKLLPRIAAFIMLMNAVYTFWLIKPALTSTGNVGHLGIHWMDVTAWLGIGGIWLWLFVSQLKRRPLVMARAVPILQERAHAH